MWQQKKKDKNYAADATATASSREIGGMQQGLWGSTLSSFIHPVRLGWLIDPLSNLHLS